MILILLPTATHARIQHKKNIRSKYEDWLPNPAKSAIEPSEYSSSNSTDIHGDYYTYGTQFDQIPPISTNFLHIFNTTPNGTFTETK